MSGLLPPDAATAIGGIERDASRSGPSHTRNTLQTTACAYRVFRQQRVPEGQRLEWKYVCLTRISRLP